MGVDFIEFNTGGDTRVEEINESSLMLARKIIISGGLVAFPTETVYGLGANALDCDAVKRIFTVKGRPPSNPLIVHVASESQIELVAREISADAEKIIKTLMPCSLTIVLKKRKSVPDTVTAGLDTVAIRMPSSNDALAFLKACAVPVAAPSANISGRPSPTRYEDVYEDLRGLIPLILKGPRCKVGIESTVLDLTDGGPRILRQGIVSSGEISLVLGKKVSTLRDHGSVVNSPGIAFKHYVPKIPLLLCLDGDTERVCDYAAKEKNAVILCVDALAGGFIGLNVIRMGQSSADYANRLFSTLRDAEKRYSVIIAIFNERDENADAVLNRLEKASEGKRL